VAFKQEVNVPLIVTIGFVSGIVVVVLILGTEAWYRAEADNELAAKALQYPNTQLVEMRTQQKNNISGYRWTSPDRNAITIPVEDAMKIMVDTQGKFPTTHPSGQ
jgi:hypothetical protein